MSIEVNRRRLLRASAGLIAAGAGLIPLVARADEIVPGDAPPPAAPLVPIFTPSMPWLEPRRGGSTFERPEWVRPREAWGADGPAQPYVTHTPVGVSLHHTGTPWRGQAPVEQHLRGIQAFHIGPQREWEDIAYHYLVDDAGTVWAGRPPTVRGNPSIYYDPSGLVLICFLGDYSTQEPTEPQVTAAARTTAWLMRRFQLAPERITGHRDHAPTTCPGTNLYRLIQEGSFARQVRDLLR